MSGPMVLAKYTSVAIDNSYLTLDPRMVLFIGQQIRLKLFFRKLIERSFSLVPSSGYSFLFKEMYLLQLLFKMATGHIKLLFALGD
ncbi:MAG: hypothetical protein H7Z13_09360 [Ferruginibacter sp.]|nr:hypothetical protein [Ferruginibacter sp.]